MKGFFNQIFKGENCLGCFKVNKIDFDGVLGFLLKYLN